MQTKNRVLDDLARVAGGAVTTLVGIKGELEAMTKTQVERLLARFDLVERDEFDAVKAMAAKARAEQERLEKRVAALEAKLKAGPKSRAAKPRTKSAARKSRP